MQDLDKTLVAFFRYDDLLGKATLFFFRELLHNDPRTKTTLETLQREHLLVKVDQIQTTQEQLITGLLHQLDEQNAKVKQALKTGAPNLTQITSQRDRLQNAIEVVPQRLQTAVSDWQTNHQAFIEFSHQFSTWTQLLESKVDKVLEAVGSLGDIDKNVKSLLQEFRDFMQRYDLSRQVKPRDEFTQHNSGSLELIRTAIAQLKHLPSDNRQYHQLVIMAGTVVSSTGDLAQAENLFVQAREQARNKGEKALASFNLFQVKLRRQAYPEALADLQSAIANEPIMMTGSFLDYGMFLQSLMLAAVEEGLAVCPQAALAEYPKIVKEILGYPEESILICGMALGYEDTEARVNSYRTPREEVDTFTQFFE
ncbi:NADH dehydrogenase [Candidatus Thiomargarita nelsonii]|uniref:NADH dehydrogenase n=1 Tax=Candidatus Thiomargarita nelsonii TaxID=1003181 RepID=A0A176RTR7_9GAMM|nr:NADH dehydrogenase [Candidatus Thiomargarita nelsonii]